MFAAVLDTSVLWPSLQRDFLLSLAVEGMYRPLWSAAILAELEYEEAAKFVVRGEEEGSAARRGQHLVAEMRRSFDDAEVFGWEGLAGTYGLPDAQDEHVVAVAAVAGAGAIVTQNLRDFPLERLPVGIEAVHPAVFAVATVELNPINAAAAVAAIAARTGRHGSRLTTTDVLDRLVSRYNMTQAVELIREVSST